MDIQTKIADKADKPTARKKKSTPREILASACVISSWGALFLIFPRYAHLDGSDETICVMLGYGLLALSAFAALGGVDATSGSQLFKSVFTVTVFGILALLLHTLANQLEREGLIIAIRALVFVLLGSGIMMFDVNAPKMLGERGRSPLAALLLSPEQSSDQSENAGREPAWTRTEGLVAVLIAALNIVAAAIQQWG